MMHRRVVAILSASILLAQPIMAGPREQKTAIELAGLLDGVGVQVEAGGVGVHVETPAGRIDLGVPPGGANAAPRAPEDPARTLLDNVGEAGIRDAIRSISEEDRERLRLKCRNVLANPDRYSEAIVLICKIVESEAEPTPLQ